MVLGFHPMIGGIISNGSPSATQNNVPAFRHKAASRMGHQQRVRSARDGYRNGITGDSVQSKAPCRRLAGIESILGYRGIKQNRQ